MNALTRIVGLALAVSLPWSAVTAHDRADSGVPSTAVVTSTTSSTFVDVSPLTPFAMEITWLADRGVTTGWEDGTYRPYQPVTRDAMAAFMYRLAGSPDFTPPTTSPFVDVSTGYQFYKEISWLATQGITTGWNTAAGVEFRPWNQITRDAMAAFLYRFKGSPSYTPAGTTPFIDVKAGMPFYAEMRWLASVGIATGSPSLFGCRAYEPYGTVKRDAMAAFMYRATEGGTTPITEGTCSPPPGPYVVNPVSPGAYCAAELAGMYGMTVKGVWMRCSVSSTDARLRWRAL